MESGTAKIAAGPRVPPLSCCMTPGPAAVTGPSGTPARGNVGFAELLCPQRVSLADGDSRRGRAGGDHDARGGRPADIPASRQQAVQFLAAEPVRAVIVTQGTAAELASTAAWVPSEPDTINGLSFGAWAGTSITSSPRSSPTSIHQVEKSLTNGKARSRTSFR